MNRNWTKALKKIQDDQNLSSYGKTVHHTEGCTVALLKRALSHFGCFWKPRWKFWTNCVLLIWKREEKEQTDSNRGSAIT